MNRENYIKLRLKEDYFNIIILYIIDKGKSNILSLLKQYIMYYGIDIKYLSKICIDYLDNKYNLTIVTFNNKIIKIY